MTGDTAAVGADVRDVAAYPDFVPATVTVIVLPTRSGVSSSVVPVAPGMAVPSADQPIVVVSGVGTQVPTVAVSVEPTTVSPAMVGSGAVNARSPPTKDRSMPVTAVGPAATVSVSEDSVSTHVQNSGPSGTLMHWVAVTV